MAYRICYEGGPQWSRIGERSDWKFRLILSVCLLAVLMTAKWCLPEFKPVLVDCFAPPEESAVQAMAQVLYDGGTLRDSLLAFCRTFLRLHGYEN